MSQTIVWAAAALFLALAFAPCLSFLFLEQGWCSRRREILDGLNDTAAQLYFQNFHPQRRDHRPARQQGDQGEPR